ncbi:unknown [Bacteroides sp. CAG:633]|nr:unknown [Bacteroides sp. CAG:633]
MKPFPAYFQSPYHIPLLQTFLNHRLYPAVRPPDPVCIAVHTLHVQPASQQEKRQNPYHQPNQPRIQPVKESKSRQQLYAQNHKGRQSHRQQTRQSCRISCYPVHHVSGMETFQFLPAAPQQVTENPVSQSVSRPDLCPHSHPVVPCIARQLQQHVHDQHTSPKRKFLCPPLRSRVNSLFGKIDEQ